jgi:hypothetical protein
MRLNPSGWARLPHDKEKTDEELAALEVGGEDIVRFSNWFYRKIVRVPRIEGKVLTALDSGGFAALMKLLTVSKQVAQNIAFY